MKKKVIAILLATMTTVALVTGCTSDALETADMTVVSEDSGLLIVDDDYEEQGDVHSSLEDEIEETAEIVMVEPVYIEYEDLFLADNFYELNREKLEEVNVDSIEKTNEKFVLSESVDLYNFEGTWNGYSKPNIKVTLFGTNKDWAEVSFTRMILYVPRTDFDKVAVKAEDIEVSSTSDVLLAEAEETTPKQETAKPKTEKPVTTEPVVVEPSTTEPIVVEPETPIVDNTKYTPEEAIAVYRSIMESNGIQWDPSIKEFASWGTGWIYLTKGQAEWAGNTDVESFRRGNSGGDSWTKYYIEVTSSDSDAVYITEWHCG